MSEPDVPVSRFELIAILAMLAATVAVAIDAMLPAFPEIAADLSPDNRNRVQLVIASFMGGLGIGTLFAGPISDAFGRQTIVIGGSAIIGICALVAAYSPSLDVLIAARFVQGIGASGPRIAAMAIARDLFRGREMARVVSFVIFAFSLAPVIAPSIGWLLIWAFGWRSIFLSFAAFSLISMTWLLMRLPETLAIENRRPFRVRKLMDGLREVFTNGQVMLAIGAQTFVFGILMSTLMSSQQIFDDVFDQGLYFPLWFGLMAILAAFSSLMNAAIVVRLGMRRVVFQALVMHGVGSGLLLAALMGDALPAAWLFPVGFIWMTSNFYLAGFAIGNINAIALEPMGHMAGLAASIITATGTVASILIAAPIGQAFDGTMIPLVASTFVLGICALLLISRCSDTEP